MKWARLYRPFIGGAHIRPIGWNNTRAKEGDSGSRTITSSIVVDSPGVGRRGALEVLI